jgi:hypothetical protein
MTTASLKTARSCTAAARFRESRIASLPIANCQWQFGDAAERTLNFMRQVYHGMGQGGAELVEATLNAIRQPVT